jgi:N-dimethylarginine dimethylaminohydrolase
MKIVSRCAEGDTPRPTKWGLDSEYGRMRDVLIGPIEHYTWQANSNAVAHRSQRMGFHFDHQVATAQYKEVVRTFEEAGVTVHTLRADPALPYQLYARDSSVMTPWGAVIMQMQRPYRRGEYVACLEFYLAKEIPVFGIVTAGSIEGGDFMVLEPGLAVCGYSEDRSTEPAVEQMKAWFEKEGWEFKPYAFDPHFLHLDVQMGMIAEKLAAVCVEAVEPDFVTWLTSRGIRIIEVSYRDAMQMGCNVVALGQEKVIIPASNTRLVQACQAEGLTVLSPDVEMISNGGGSLHCMCQALRRDPA